MSYFVIIHSRQVIIHYIIISSSGIIQYVIGHLQCFIIHRYLTRVSVFEIELDPVAHGICYAADSVSFV